MTGDGAQAEYDQWWHENEQEPATVVIRCGCGGCRKVVGELKTDGAATLVMWHQRFGEVTVSTPPPSPPATLDPIRIRLHQRDSRQLRPTGDGRRVTRRHRAEPLIRPLDDLSTAVCPVHGLLPIPFPFQVIDDLRAFIADTQRGSKRTYVLFRDEPLDS
ncbi:hypothetical protein NGTWS1702_34560 [Mycolicibacterium cyprinidarum]|uniref:Uncharacterized protein n=1 Tax=Mycolicibacterium cyprinidarum TaxID=2860311 RepID=A0ABQ4V4K3_9MYCO|nr:hypothetical protein NGTWS1702_34560 [Mycolicibacterium sp. NGTWSNA01]